MSNQCKNIFDLSSIYDYVEFDKPLYSIIAKRRTAKLITMSPEEYLQTITVNFGNNSVEETLEFVSKEAIKKYAKLMKQGEKFPVIYYHKDSSLQEGRHRAVAAKLLGCKEIPVIEFRKIDNPELLDIINEIKDKTKEQLNDYFVNLGFKKGITDLGYYDLKRYVQYNLNENYKSVKKYIHKILNNLILD